jgi:hypothetical protein
MLLTRKALSRRGAPRHRAGAGRNAQHDGPRPNPGELCRGCRGETPRSRRAGNIALWRARAIAQPIQRTTKIALDRDSGGALHQTKTSCSIKALEIPGRNGCKPPAARVTTNPTGSCDRDVRMSGGSEDGYREQPPFARRQQSIRQNDPGKGCMHPYLFATDVSCGAATRTRLAVWGTKAIGSAFTGLSLYCGSVPFFFVSGRSPGSQAAAFRMSEPVDVDHPDHSDSPYPSVEFNRRTRAWDVRSSLPAGSLYPVYS